VELWSKNKFMHTHPTAEPLLHQFIHACALGT